MKKQKKAPIQAPAKKVSSEFRELPQPVHMTELVLPSHTNDLGTIFGGTIMAWIDIAGAISARRYARNPVVTLCIDYLQFIVPIKIGYVVRTNAQITFVGRSSMEVEVIVEAENPSTGEVRKATQAYLTYVSVDEFGRPKPVPPFQPKTAEEKRKFKEGAERRERRLEMSKKMKI